MESKKSKLRVVSDGTPMGTKIYASDGSEIKGVTRVEWAIGLYGVSELSIRIHSNYVDLDVEVEGERSKALIDVSRECNEFEIVEISKDGGTIAMSRRSFSKVGEGR